jgi:hypothetical protein
VEAERHEKCAKITIENGAGNEEKEKQPPPSMRKTAAPQYSRNSRNFSCPMAAK